MHHFAGVNHENYQTLTMGQTVDLMTFVNKLYKD